MESGPSKPTPEKVREWVQFALLLFASVWGTWWGYHTFVYKEIIVPSKRPAALAISGSLEEVGRKGDMVLVRARIHVVNNRDIRIYAPALWLTLKGLQMRAKAASVQGLPPRAENRGLPPEKFATYSEDKAQFIARWRLPDWQTWYEPSDQTTNEELFFVPLNLYEAIQLRVEVYVTKSIDAVASVEWRVATDGSFVPTLMLKVKGRGSDNNQTLSEQFEPVKNRQHKEWEVNNGVGQNWSVTTLSLLPTAVERRQEASPKSNGRGDR
jgi:hypothetical protein